MSLSSPSSRSLHIAILAGGLAGERDVSFASAAEAQKAIDGLGYCSTLIDADRDLPAKLKECAPDIAFVALHGAYGEDGCIQGLLELMNIPYTHSGVCASAIAMDKYMTKLLLEPRRIPFARSKRVAMADIEGELSDFGYPCVIKPLSEGSSLGVKVLMGPERLSDEYKNAYDLVLLERFIEGKELSVAVLDGVPLAVVELTPHNGFYDYENKYTDNKTTHTLPASVPAHVYDRAMKIAADAHELIGARGLTRSDFRYNPLEYNDNKSDACGLYFLEINTHPGLTPLSLAPEMAAYAGISFSDLVDRLIKAARCDH